MSLAYALNQGLETAACGITVMIPALYGAYMGIGHLDLRTAVKETEGE